MFGGTAGIDHRALGAAVLVSLVSGAAIAAAPPGPSGVVLTHSPTTAGRRLATTFVRELLTLGPAVERRVRPGSWAHEAPPDALVALAAERGAGAAVDVTVTGRPGHRRLVVLAVDAGGKILLASRLRLPRAQRRSRVAARSVSRTLAKRLEGRVSVERFAGDRSSSRIPVKTAAQSSDDDHPSPSATRLGGMITGALDDVDGEHAADAASLAVGVGVGVGAGRMRHHLWTSNGVGENRAAVSSTLLDLRLAWHHPTWVVDGAVGLGTGSLTHDAAAAGSAPTVRRVRGVVRTGGRLAVRSPVGELSGEGGLGLRLDRGGAAAQRPYWVLPGWRAWGGDLWLGVGWQRDAMMRAQLRGFASPWGGFAEAEGASGQDPKVRSWGAQLRGEWMVWRHLGFVAALRYERTTIQFTGNGTRRPIGGDGVLHDAAIVRSDMQASAGVSLAL